MIYSHLGKKQHFRATVIFYSLRVHETENFSQVWINDLYSHLGKKRWHAHATVIFDSLCVCVKPKIFSQVWINDLYSHLGKNNNAHAPQSFLTLCACACETKNFCFPSQNKWFIHRLGKKTTCSHATVIFDSLRAWNWKFLFPKSE
jgi:hypothetical protein